MATHDHARDSAHANAIANAHAPVAVHAHAIVPGADKAPAFVGLVAGGILLFVILFGVVKITQSRFGHEGGERPAAGAEHR